LFCWLFRFFFLVCFRRLIRGTSFPTATQSISTVTHLLALLGSSGFCFCRGQSIFCFCRGQSELLIERSRDVQEDITHIDLRVILEERNASAVSALKRDPFPNLEARRVIERAGEPVHHFRCFIGLLDPVGDDSA